MNKAFWSQIKHFGRLLGKIYQFLTPSKSDERVPSQHGAPTCTPWNVTYWEVSQETYVQTLPVTGYWVWGHKEKFRPSGCLGGGGGGLGKTMGVAEGCNSPLQWEGGGTFWQLKQSNYSRQEIPSDAQNCLFPQNTFLLWTYYYLNISQQAEIGLKNRYFEEQIHFVPVSIATILTILPLRKKTLTFPGFSLKS